MDLYVYSVTFFFAREEGEQVRSVDSAAMPILRFTIFAPCAKSFFGSINSFVRKNAKKSRSLFSDRIEPRKLSGFSNNLHKPLVACLFNIFPLLGPGFFFLFFASRIVDWSQTLEGNRFSFWHFNVKHFSLTIFFSLILNFSPVSSLPSSEPIHELISWRQRVERCYLLCIRRKSQGCTWQVLESLAYYRGFADTH